MICLHCWVYSRAIKIDSLLLKPGPCGFLLLSLAWGWGLFTIGQWAYDTSAAGRSLARLLRKESTDRRQCLEFPSVLGHLGGRQEGHQAWKNSSCCPQRFWFIQSVVVLLWKRTLVCFVCLSVTLVNVRLCAHDFAMEALEYRNDFDVVG